MSSRYGPLRSVDESASELRTRHRTLFVPAEDAISISSHEVVHAVTDSLRYQAHEAHRLPQPREFACHEKRGVTSHEETGIRRSIVRHNIERGQIARILAVPLEHGLTGRALERSEIEDTAVVVCQQELHEAVAEAAHAVVQDQVSAFGLCPWLHSRINHALILMNMFTENVKLRKRGRPPGRTAQGTAARDRLYATAMQMIAEGGYQATTLRDIAGEAGVSVGLLYRYFPSKQAVIIAFYEELSADYAHQAASMRPGKWRDRFMFALRTSLHVLQPHRVALRALVPVLVGDPDDGVFAVRTAFSRQRVQRVFEDAVAGSSDAPKPPLAEALGRLLYLVHLAVLLWWLLDKTPKQRATVALVALAERLLPSATLTLRLPSIRQFVIAVDELIREGLFGSPIAA